MDFDKICTIFTMQEPYYGILLSAMDRFETRQIPTMGVCRSGNVFRLGYNPDFVADKDIDTMMVLLKHECIHIAFNVFTIFPDETKDRAEQMIRNMAADMEANSYIDFSKAKGINPLLAGSMGWDNCLGTMEYYKRLVQQNQQEQQQEAQQPTMPCNGGKGGTGNKSVQNRKNPQNTDPDDDADDNAKESGQEKDNGPQLSQKMQDRYDDSFDDHSMWPDDMTEEEADNLKQVIDDLVDFAAQEVEKACGKIPGEMEGRIKLIRDKKKPKPIADWKKYFRRYIGNEFSDIIRKSRKRESKRFPDAAGNRHKHKSHILVAIDTSGSVSMPEYNEFFGQIRTMKDVTFHVVECDARIQHEYDFTGIVPQTLHGGGGTDFQPVVDLYNQNRRKYEGLVYFTDGYCGIPCDTPKETLWVISSNGDQQRNKYLVNGASVVFIPKKHNNG